MEYLTFESVAETALSQTQEKAIADLIAPIYARVDFGGRSFFQQRHSHRLMVWAKDENSETLVAHMALTYRVVRLGDDLWDVMGIAEVATKASHRRQGLASTMLERAEALAQMRGADALLLFGTEGIYTQARFERARNPVRYVDMRGCRTGDIVETTNHALMVRGLRQTVWDDRKTLDLMGAIF